MLSKEYDKYGNLKILGDVEASNLQETPAITVDDTTETVSIDTYTLELGDIDDVKAEINAKLGGSTAPNSVKGNNTDATANAFDVSITAESDYTSWTDKLLVYSGVLKTIITNIFASIGTNTTNISTLEDTISTLAGAKATFTFAEYTLTTSKVKLDLVLDAQSSNTDIFEVDETNDWVDVKIDSGFSSALNLDFIKSGATDVVVTFNVYNSSDVLFETHSFTLKGTGSISQVVNLLSASVPVDTYYMTVSVDSVVGTIVLQSSSKALMDASINGSGVFQMQEPSTEITSVTDDTEVQIVGNKKVRLEVLNGSKLDKDFEGFTSVTSIDSVDHSIALKNTSTGIQERITGKALIEEIDANKKSDGVFNYSNKSILGLTWDTGLNLEAIATSIGIPEFWKQTGKHKFLTFNTSGSGHADLGGVYLVEIDIRFVSTTSRIEITCTSDGSSAIAKQYILHPVSNTILAPITNWDYISVGNTVNGYTIADNPVLNYGDVAALNAETVLFNDSNDMYDIVDGIIGRFNINNTPLHAPKNGTAIFVVTPLFGNGCIQEFTYASGEKYWRYTNGTSWSVDFQSAAKDELDVVSTKADDNEANITTLTTDATISALEIDFSDARTFSKSISADSTFTIANDTNGMVKDVAITADTTDRVVTLPSAVKTIGSTTITASTTSIFTFKKINDVIYCEIKSYT